MHKAVLPSVCVPVFALAASVSQGLRQARAQHRGPQGRPAFLSQGLRQARAQPRGPWGRPAAGAMASWSDAWVRQTARRLERTFPGRVGECRWAEAAASSDGVRPALHTGQETLFETRMDLSLRRPFVSPQRSTFMVEGRPVQVMCLVDRLSTSI